MAELNPVILTLKIAEGTTSSESRIAEAQNNLLKEIQGQHFEGLTRYRFTPLMALSIDDETLEILQQSPHVLSIKSDAIMQTQEATAEPKDILIPSASHGATPPAANLSE